ncbi:MULTISPECIES: AraC family transcriptional regulator [unclassified Spirosoma]|uniref:helix-turn-helix domain-containing protein n=1 Tax=unclassified Spirosoma TaxID=2621999 RepID=UPI001AC069B1|nr:MULTISPECIES: helix-turn-helix domain-containing protein [unclassified Spirosoma]MBN8820455.1 helix-turn-helix transcriptional regulator [Spirosoma sp.]
MFTFLGALTLLWALGVLLKWPVFKEIEWLLTGCLFVLGYIGYIDPDFFTVSLLPGSTVKTVANPDFAQFTDEIELQRIRSAFRDDALHRQPKLTVDDVATFLHLPPRYISFLVNTRCATNFTTFVNQYRVDEVIQKLGDPKQQYKTILAIALEAGFNSKSSFNQVFKDHTGKAPSFYLRPTQNSSINHSA